MKTLAITLGLALGLAFALPAVGSACPGKDKTAKAGKNGKGKTTAGQTPVKQPPKS